ncbi:MAG: tRNA (adenosine(37)-N6)-threonylcarbamoyltransferase complex transferase subunit TsaD, partial [Clostridia bacterium]
ALKKTERCALAACGGVAANSILRAQLENLAKDENCSLYLPPLALCGDNAAMIGSQAYYEFNDGITASTALNAYATMPVDRLFGI